MTANEAPEISITVERSDLAGVMARVSSIVERRNTIPILSNALIEVDADGVSFKATDLDIEVRETFQARTTDAQGRVTVPAQMLSDIARKLPSGGEVGLVCRDGRLSVACGRSSFDLPTLPAGDFPNMTEGSYAATFRMGAGDFAEMLARTKFAVSTEETRYYLNGIYFHIRDEKLTAVATDGHRLALCATEAPTGAAEMPSVIIPRKTIAEVSRLLGGAVSGSDVEISVSVTKIKFTIGSITMVSKLIDGTFPDYERVIPRNNPHKMTAEGGHFGKAIDRVATISTEKSRSIKFILSQGKLTLEAGGYGSQANEEMDVHYEGVDLLIGFNAKYINDSLAQVDSKTVEFFFEGPAAPALVLDPDSPESLFVLMPLRV